MNSNSTSVNATKLIWFEGLDTLTPGIYTLKVDYSTNDTTSNPQIITIEVISADFYKSFSFILAPTVTTLLSNPTILSHQSVSDRVTVSGFSGFPIPTGTVRFQYQNATGTWVTFDNETLTNGTANSIPIQLNATGTANFRATYDGDSQYFTGTSALETLTVQPNTNITTAFNVTSPIVFGTHFHDTANLTTGYTSGFNMTGTISFYWSNDTGTTWHFLSSAPAPATNGTVDSSDFSSLLAGTYYFKANYTGDTNYDNATTGATDEPMIIGRAAAITTALNVTSPIVFGTHFHDTANLTGNVTGFSMTGTISFYWSTDAATWNFLSSSAAPANGGIVNSIDVSNLGAGTFYFKANYTSSTTNYTSCTSGMTAEPLTVNPATPSITTALNVTSIKLGASVKDTVTVWGLANPPYPVPTGTVTFWVTLPNGTLKQLDTEPLIGGQAVSNDYTPLAKGSYQFNATYNGNGNYTTAVNTGPEPLTVKGSFGNTIMGASTVSISDTIRGSNFTLTLGNSYAESITVALNCGKSRTGTVNCAIYYASNGSLVAQTTAQSLSLDTPINWYTFTFSSNPLLYNNTVYRLVVWASTVSGDTVNVAYSAGGAGASKGVTYAASFPNPLTGMTGNTDGYSIYCTVY